VKFKAYFQLKRLYKKRDYYVSKNVFDKLNLFIKVYKENVDIYIALSGLVGHLLRTTNEKITANHADNHIGKFLVKSTVSTKC